MAAGFWTGVEPVYNAVDFANPRDVRHSWERTLRDARLPRFVLYNLRHAFASRLSAAGVSDLFVAQMIGHSSPSILQTYAKAIDEYRRDAVRKLEEMRANKWEIMVPGVGVEPPRPEGRRILSSQAGS